MKYGVRGGYTGGDGSLPRPAVPTTGSGVQTPEGVGCTCHPDEAPTPCPRKHAFRECVRAALHRKALLFKEGAKRQYDGTGDMWFFELWHFLGDVEEQLED